MPLPFTFVLSPLSIRIPNTANFQLSAAWLPALRSLEGEAGTPETLFIPITSFTLCPPSSDLCPSTQSSVLIPQSSLCPLSSAICLLSSVIRIQLSVKILAKRFECIRHDRRPQAPDKAYKIVDIVDRI